MTAKGPFDPEFGKNARCWYCPVRSIGQLMIVVALSGLTLWVVPMCSGGKVSGILNIRRVPAGPTVIQGPLRRPPFKLGQPRDRFVIVARPEIDQGMVIRAPDIDAGMVIHPGTRGRSSTVAPMVGGGRLSPGQSPVPVPDQGAPHDWSPYPPVLPRPMPR